MAAPDYAQSINKQIYLRWSDTEAIVSPYGASLRGYYRRPPGAAIVDIALPYADATVPPSPPFGQVCVCRPEEIGEKIGGQGDTLIPFPGRIKEGRYSFNGAEYQMPLNDKEGPNAIHGFLRALEWNVEEVSETSALFSVHLDERIYAGQGYPFSLEALVRYQVGDGGLVCSFVVTNIGGGPAPAAAGFHPYFTAGSLTIDDATLEAPFQSMLEIKDLIPTGRVLDVEGTPYDFRTARTIGASSLNTCYLNPTPDADGKTRIHLSSASNGRVVTVWMNKAFRYVVLYSGDPLPDPFRRRSLAIEPMTCGADGFNHPEWGLASLSPGESLSGEWGANG